ncbi:glycosyltransferase [Nonomuraea sp. PA05]|uniref:glycosyltransferase n=1 Tax=Nonomuraea sp. PA05 TaxID=2604466 RepID=UPI0011D3C070|nr:glycosyltransferase [Nonomuraea sp. PA05]TYB58068.1 glycosyltransferase [Nonomuraea sp. PA05]
MDTRAAMEPSPRVLDSAARPASVDIVIPVLNEERALPGCVRTLARFLDAGFPLPWRITIVDNGSTDATWPVATALAGEFAQVHARRLDIRGRGAALRAAWLDSPADVVAYMDVDLSTDLGALFPLVASVAGGHSELAVGTRLAPGARTRRSVRREVVSRGYNALLRHGFGVRFSDAQCGFKAARTDAVRPLVRRIRDDSWFFDTELLLLAEHNGLRVHEVPVDWIEDGDSRVKVIRTAVDDLRGMVRIAWSMATGRARVQVRRAEPAPMHPDAVLTRPIFDISVFIGLIPGILHVLAYIPLREMWSPVLANLGALVLARLVKVTAARRSAFRTVARFAVLSALTTAAVLCVPAADVGAVAATYCLLALLRWVFSRTRN